MTIVMGLDQHRAQITTDWVDTSTGEVSRARVAPADRPDVRRFFARFRGRQLEVALEARALAGCTIPYFSRSITVVFADAARRPIE